MSSPVIHDLRTTFIWTRTYFDLLQSDAPKAFPLGFLAQGHTYKPQVQTLLNSGRIPSGLTLPWRTVAGQLFWRRYFGDQIPGHITPDVAWKKLVPLRARPQVTFGLEPPEIRVGTEAYYYPFGVVLAVTLHVRGNLPLDQAVTLAQDCARAEKVSLMAGAQTLAEGHLRTVAQECLDILCKDALGSVSRDADTTTDPLTVATVVRGSNVDPAVPLKNHPEKEGIQRFLEGLANWQPNWATVALPSLDDPRVLLDVSGSRSSPGDLLYTGKAHKSVGRVVWFPGRFTLSSQHLNSLGCYHRNLMMATAHVESLARLVGKIAVKYPNQTYRNRVNVRWCAHNAVLLLKDLYDGAGTYRSWSLRQQIKDSACLPAINTVLTDNGALPIQ
jgi:hypothetical protein